MLEMTTLKKKEKKSQVGSSWYFENSLLLSRISDRLTSDARKPGVYGKKSGGACIEWSVA